MTYADQSKRHDPDSYWPDRDYRPWNHSGIRVVAAPELASSTASSERILPCPYGTADNAGLSYLKNGQANAVLGAPGGEDSSFPMMNETEEGPPNIDHLSGYPNAHVGMPPSDGSSGNTVGG